MGNIFRKYKYIHSHSSIIYSIQKALLKRKFLNVLLGEKFDEKVFQNLDFIFSLFNVFLFFIRRMQKRGSIESSSWSLNEQSQSQFVAIRLDYCMEHKKREKRIKIKSHVILGGNCISSPHTHTHTHTHTKRQ
jgi:hypothetical protein